MVKERGGTLRLRQWIDDAVKTTVYEQGGCGLDFGRFRGSNLDTRMAARDIAIHGREQLLQCTVRSVRIGV